MNIEEMQKEENFEHEVLDRLKCLDPTDFDYNAVDGSYVDAVLKARDIILTAYEKEKEKNKELEKMLNLKSHKKRYNTMNYIKKNKLNKFDTVGICQDMRAFKRTGEIKYRAYITFQNKQYTLGTYTSLDKAKEARRKGEMMVENIKKNFVEKIKGEE